MNTKIYGRFSSLAFFCSFAAMVGWLILHFYLPHLAQYWGVGPFSTWQTWLIHAANATGSFAWFFGTTTVFAASIAWRLVVMRRLRRSTDLRGFEVTLPVNRIRSEHP